MLHSGPTITSAIHGQTQIHLSFTDRGSLRPLCPSKDTSVIGGDRAYADRGFRPVQVMCELVTRSEDEIHLGSGGGARLSKR